MCVRCRDITQSRKRESFFFPCLGEGEGKPTEAETLCLVSLIVCSPFHFSRRFSPWVRWLSLLRLLSQSVHQFFWRIRLFTSVWLSSPMILSVTTAFHLFAFIFFTAGLWLNFWYMYLPILRLCKGLKKGSTRITLYSTERSLIISNAEFAGSIRKLRPFTKARYAVLFWALMAVHWRVIMTVITQRSDALMETLHLTSLHNFGILLLYLAVPTLPPLSARNAVPPDTKRGSSRDRGIDQENKDDDNGKKEGHEVSGKVKTVGFPRRE